MLGRFDTIFWDVDGTLLDFDAAETVSLRNCMLSRGIEVSEAQIQRYKQINHEYWKRFERGEVEKERLYSDRFLDWFMECGFIDLDPVSMNRDYQVSLGNTPVPYEDTFSVLEYLAPLCRQYVTSNGSITAQEGKLAKSGIGKLMDGIFISEYLGVPKPEAKFFKLCAERIPNYDPGKTVIIGDSLTSDMLGGNNAGITCIWFNPGGTLRIDGIHINAEIKTLSEVPELLSRL